MRGSVNSLWFFVALALLAVPLSTVAVADDSAEEAALRQRLGEVKLNVAVEHQTFGDVVKLLRVQTGLNIHIDPRIEYDVSESVVTGLFVNDLPLTTVLNLLADTGGEETVWTVRGNTVMFTHREFARRALHVRIYPVAALVSPRTDFTPPPSGLVTDPARRDYYEEGFYPFGTVDELIELIKGAVSPHFWEETEGADVRSMGEFRLVVKASSKVHAAIDAFFAHLASLSADAVLVEVHAVQATAEPAASGSALTAADAAALIAGPTAGPALRMAVREGLQSTAFVGQRRAFVAGYGAKFAGQSAERDPNVETIELGMAARVRAIPGPEGERILLKLDVAVAELSSIRSQGESEELQVRLPGRTIVRRDGTSLLKPGAWHWAEGGNGGDGGWGFLVRATPVRQQGSEATPPGAFRIPNPEAHESKHPLDVKRLRGLAWEEADLDQIASYLRTVTGLNFYITPRVRVELFEEVMVNLHLDDASVSTVLDLVTEPYGMAWRLADNVVTIHTRDHAEQRMALRYFDVKDLVTRLSSATARDRVDSDESREPSPIFTAEGLVDLIRETVGGESYWEDPAAIEVRNRIIIARNTREILDTIERLLDGLRASRRLVVTTVDQLDLDPETAARILGVGSTTAAPLFLDAAAQAALRQAEAGGGVRRLSRERIVSLEGSGTPKATGREIAFVGDYDVKVSNDGDASMPVRVIDTLTTGTRIHLRPIPSYPADHVYVEITAERTDLADMGSGVTPYGEIDLPTTNVWRVATGLRIPAGRSAAVFASRTAEGWRVLLVTPTRVSLEKK